MRNRAPLLLFAVLVACGGGSPPEHGDAATSSDAALVDASIAVDAHRAPDAARDAGATDAGQDAGPAAFGTIVSTACGTVVAELDDPTPSFHQVRLDFMMDGFDDPAERSLLTAGAQEILEEGTAGGSSALSEAFAFEVLARCEGAALIKTETEIGYDPVTSTKTDMLVEIGGTRIGVSVVRAYQFPPGSPYPVATATPILRRKLEDILESSANVVVEDDWQKQILAVIAYGDMHAESIRTAWDAMDDTVRADTIVYVVVTDGDDMALY